MTFKAVRVSRSFSITTWVRAESRGADERRGDDAVPESDDGVDSSVIA
jgi:hypothetical protein